MERTIEVLLRDLDELQTEGGARGMAFRLRVLGYTDEAGSYAQNRDLRQRRAEWLATRVMKVLHPPSTVSVDQEAIYTLPGSSVRATSIAVETYPVNP